MSNRLLVVNRSFWPDSLVQGEALLSFAEEAAQTYDVTVVTQVQAGFNEALVAHGRGAGVRFWAARAFSDSKSHFVIRMLEVVYFTLWTIWCLIWSRPQKIYVSTNPPILVPFVAYLYAKISRSQLYYHVQDIHPEALNTTVHVNRIVFRALRWIDSLTMRGAHRLITITQTMADKIHERSQVTAEVLLIDNPAFQDHAAQDQIRDGDVIFCGNVGRFQRIPILVAAIDSYLKGGGALEFTFIGGGIHSGLLDKLALDHPSVTYLGPRPADESSIEIARHKWSLLPIEDAVLDYAFPSKTSAYALAGCRILAICGANTSVAKWVQSNQIGLVADPDRAAIVAALSMIEKNSVNEGVPSNELHQQLTIPYYVEKLHRIINDEE